MSSNGSRISTWGSRLLRSMQGPYPDPPVPEYTTEVATAVHKWVAIIFWMLATPGCYRFAANHFGGHINCWCYECKKHAQNNGWFSKTAIPTSHWGYWLHTLGHSSSPKKDRMSNINYSVPLLYHPLTPAPARKKWHTCQLWDAVEQTLSCQNATWWCLKNTLDTNSLCILVTHCSLHRIYTARIRYFHKEWSRHWRSSEYMYQVCRHTCHYLGWVQVSKGG